MAPVRDGRADLVVGSRFLVPGGFRPTASRWLGIRYLSMVIRLRCGARVTDVTSGYRAAGTGRHSTLRPDLSGGLP